LLKLSRSKITNQENAKNLNSELAEECRKALEKHYNGAVPTPQAIAKK
jgi:hypothetical protein